MGSAMTIPRMPSSDPQMESDNRMMAELSPMTHIQYNAILPQNSENQGMEDKGSTWDVKSAVNARRHYKSEHADMCSRIGARVH